MYEPGLTARKIAHFDTEIFDQYRQWEAQWDWDPVEQPRRYLRGDETHLIYLPVNDKRCEGFKNLMKGYPPGITSLWQDIIKPLLEKVISSQIEGKCIVEGYIKPNTVKVLTYSSGIIQGSNILFEVVFECLICCPVEGMHIDAVAKNITKAGIRAEYDEIPTPVIIFIARDHHYNSSYFAEVKEGDRIKVRVIGQRYELNDKYISIIAELLEPKNVKKIKSKPTKQPILIFEE